MKLPNIDVYLPTKSTQSKEIMFGDIWDAYIDVLNAHVNSYNDDEDLFKEIVNEVMEESIIVTRGISDVGRKLTAFFHQDQLEIGPNNTLDIFKRI